MGLKEYRRKRQFDRTPEPAGGKARSNGHSFVIQKHAASHLHYDFRLEMDGVLKSWAVPKGPSLDPSVKRLAVQVEDHPIEYGGFEGTIPEGQYGGGTVLLWDRGTWEPVGDAERGLKAGKLKFHLDGEKLHGGWMLVRSHMPGGKEGRQWLLIKERDDDAQATKKGDIVDKRPLSVATGRDLDQIATDADATWDSSKPSRSRTQKSTSRNEPAKSKRSKSTRRTARKRSGKPPAALVKELASLDGARHKAMPRTVEVQLATLTEQAPQGEDWIHEIKFDGYRMICRIDHGKIELISRNDQNWTSRLQSVVQAVESFPASQAILDGEVVAMNAEGISDFQTLQNVFRAGGTAELRFYAFDLLYLEGYDLRGVRLDERKRILKQLFERVDSERLLFSDDIQGEGAAFFEKACDLKLEGIISKRRDRPYAPGRGYDWLKVKCSHTEEFVIGGFTDPAGTRQGFGALLVGTHNKDGELIYAGKVGTGFDHRTLGALLKQMQALEQEESPFADFQRRTGPARNAHWIKPTLVAQLTYGNRTRDGRLRHASFQGLREDKPAEDVMPDKAVPVEKAVRKAGRGKSNRRTAASKTTASPQESSRARKTAASPARVRSHSRSTKSSAVESIEGYDPQKEEFAGIRLTSPDKPLDVETGITKLEYAAYLRDVADWILPHVKNRPLALVRCPEGRAKQCFYQKHPSPGTPDALRRVPIREKDEVEDYVVVDDVAGLVSLAQVGAIEIHAWGSQADALETPDRLIFDLDPDPSVPWKRVVDGAREVREFLKALKLKSFVKTTGGKGLHVVVPIKPEHDWDTVKDFCKRVADSIVTAAPDRYTSNMSKAARKGLIFVDYLRNGRGSTAIVPYSTRARPQMTVAVPLKWRELSPRIKSDHFHLRNVRRRLASLRSDPWEEMARTSQSLTKAMRALDKIVGRSP